MRSIRLYVVTAVLVLASGGLVAAQVARREAARGARSPTSIDLGVPSVQLAPPPPAPAEPPIAPAPQPQPYRGGEPTVVRFGQSYVLGPDADIGGLVLMSGRARIDGHVRGDVVVLLGDAEIGPTATIDGSTVAVAGNVSVAEGATIRDDLVVVGGTFDAPSAFTPGGQQVIIGSPALGSSIRAVVPWLTRGLLLGRVVVPSLRWVWTLLGISFLLAALVTLAFPRGVAQCADTLSKRPMTTLATGMLSLILIGPLLALLMASVVGIVVVPFAAGAIVCGWILGKVAVSRWVGAGLVAQEDPANRFESLRSLAIGFAAIVIVYMIPILGLAAWALVGVFGFGTAVLTLMSTLRRERPAKPPKPAPAPLAAPAPQRTRNEFVPPAFDSKAPISSAMPPNPSEAGGGSTGAATAESWAAASAAEAAGSAAASADGGPVSPSVAATDLRSFPRATLLDRVVAGALDAFLVLIVTRLLAWRHDQALFFLLLSAYHIAFWAVKGTTVGSIIAGLRIIRTDGEPLRMTDAVVRGLSSLFSAAAVGTGFWWIQLGSNRDRQAWHDIIAGTLVVKVPAGWPLP